MEKIVDRTKKNENTDTSNQLTVLRDDVNASLRHVHQMSMQTKLDMIDVTSRLFALMEELIANEQLDLKNYEDRRLRIHQNVQQRAEKSVMVNVEETEDKYKMEGLPQIDCKSRLDLCKGRCCKLTFALSFQDLDEKIVKWDYSQPYQIRHNESGFCVHHSTEKNICLVYDNRPAICRGYDCRDDKRIWIDFDKRIIAPEQELDKIKEGKTCNA